MKATFSHILSLLLTGVCFTTTARAAAPPAPQNVQQAWLGLETLLYWDETPAATAYNVYRADGVNTTWAQVATNVALPRWRDGILSQLPSFYVVTAVNADGESDVSDIATVNSAPSYEIWMNEVSPWLLNVTPTNALVTWTTTNPSGEQGLVEWGAGVPDATNLTFALFNTNYLLNHSFLLTNLVSDTLYHFRVTSINAERGGTSLASSFTTPGTNHPPVVTFTLYTSIIPYYVMFQITDSNFPPQTITYELTQPTNGTLSGPWPQWGQEGTSWSMFYQPNPGARGLDSFTITAFDGVDHSAPAVITVSNWLNQLPPAGWIDQTVVEDTPTAITLPHLDPDGDPITFEITSVGGGTLSGTPPHLIFTPNTNSTWGAGLTYTVSDGYGTTNGYVFITITPVNDPPLVFPYSATVMENAILGIWPFYYDLEGGSFIMAITRAPEHGVMSGHNFDWQYVPHANFHGWDSFEFVVVEADGTTSAPTLGTIQVIGVNDPPTVPPQTVYLAEGAPASFTVNATDPDGDPLTYWLNSGPTHGTLSGTLPNLTYTPEPGFIGFDSFNYSASDGFESRPNVVTLGVGVNSLPPVDGLRRRTFLDGIVRLWWNGVPGAQYYNVYRADGSNAPFTLLASGVTATNFNDTTAQWQQPYWYRVRSWDGAYEGQPSAAVYAYPDGSGVLNLDMQMWSIHSTTGRVQFYSSIIGGTEGIFEYGTNRNYGVFLENTNILPFQRFALSNLTPATLYYFRITATDAKGNATVASTNFFQDWFATELLPFANAQSVSTAEDTAANITLSGIDSNYTFHPLTFAIVSGPAHGTLTGSGANRTYTPTLNYSGPDSFTFKVNNGEVDSAPGTVSLTVTPVNDAPVAANFSFTTTEDTWATRPALFTDVEGGTMTVLVVSQPAHGAASVVGTNFLYLAATNYNGPDSFTYRVFDGQSLGNIATVSITVTPLNDQPIASPQTLTTPEDAALLVYPVGSDPESSPLILQVQTLPAHGTLTPAGTNLLYTPAFNYNGPDSFTVRVSDGQLPSAVATVSITVTPVNDRPTASGLSGGVFEDTPQTYNLGGYDPDGDSLTATVLTQPAHGTLTGTGNSRTYTPATNYSGPDSFTFLVSDGSTDSPPATVSLLIVGLNDAPVVEAQAVSVAEDDSTAIVLNATDVDSTPLTYTVLATPANGTLTGTVPNLTYTPNANFNGADSLTFSASDGSLSSTGVVNITVTPVNDPPTVQSQSVTTSEDAAANITFTSSDIDGDVLSFVIVSAPSHGTLTGTGATRTYTPAPNYNGPDSFTFKVSDGPADSAPATVSLTITAVNDTPVADAQAVTTPEDSAITITLTGSDAEGSPLTFILGTLHPTHGTVSGTPPDLVYTPDPNFNGPDLIQFGVSDGVLVSLPVWVTINVTPVNDPPVAQPGTVTTTEDGFPQSVALNGSDLDGDALTYIVVSNPAHGTLTGSSQILSYQPAANFNGADSFQFKVNDGAADSAPVTFNITVTPANDAPTVTNMTFTTVEDAPVSFTLNGSDLDGDTLTFSAVGPLFGEGTISGTQPNLVFTPAPNFTGIARLDAVVFDGQVTSIGTVQITVTPVNDAPAAYPESRTVAEDSSVNITLTGSDVEGSPLTYTVVGAPVHGTLTGTGANRTYTPAANYNGPDSFTFKVNDGSLDSAPATISLTITPVNDAPVANAQSASTAEDAPVNLTLTGSDVEGSALTCSIITAPAHGTLTGSGTSRTYTPAANYNGPDSFTFKVNDGTLDSASATVTLSVTAVNDAPVANAQSVSTAYNTPVNITLTGSDAEGSALTFTTLTTPANGTFTGTGASRTFTPNIGWSGTTSFTFKVNDGGLDSTTATVTITVTAPPAVPPAPSALTATAISRTQINLAWTDNAPAEDGFKIERSTSATSGWAQIATVGPNVTTYSSTGLTKNTTYYYRVRAYNALGNSAYSNTASAKTLK